MDASSKCFKAYIPLRRKTTGVVANANFGVGVHPTQNFVLAIPTCSYLKALKFALPRMRNIKFVLPPTQNPNVSQWNIGSCVGHVYFFFFGVDFICVGSRFSVEYGLKSLCFFPSNQSIGNYGWVNYYWILHQLVYHDMTTK